jgi:hypothetical protein
MARRRLLLTAATSVSAFALAGAGLAGSAHAAARGAAGHGQACPAGAHTLSPYGAHVYPDTGNGGYTSVHTDVYLVYNATANKFLPGNHVVLTDRATQCLTSFSLDFERKSANAADGPDMRVRSVTVNGRPADFTFVHYGGGNITESQLEAGFRHWLPSKSAACRARLSEFFTQWFDTAYPTGGGTNRPAITGPGLAGPGFYDSSCRA